MPRKVSEYFKTMHYVLLKRMIQQSDGTMSRKYLVFCTICGKELANTGKARLEAHRRICFQPETDESVSNVKHEIADSENIEENMTCDNENTELNIDSYVTSLNKGTNKDNIDVIVDKGPAVTTKRQLKSASKILKKRKNDVNLCTNLLKDDKIKITDAIGKFFFGCNIPLNVIESEHFKNLIITLRPSYKYFIPGIDKLAGSILEQEYSNLISEAAEHTHKYSVLLLGGWKNVSEGTKTIVSLIYNVVSNNSTFIHSKDITIESDFEDITEFIEESVTIAKISFNTKIYAIVLDNAETIQLKSNLSNVCYINCNYHFANLLAEDIFTKTHKIQSCLDKAMVLINEYKYPELEKDLESYKMAAESATKWDEYRNYIFCVKNNVASMREIALTADFKIEQEIENILLDESFENDCEDSINLLDPICNFIKAIQSKTCNLSKAVKLWNALLDSNVYEDVIKSQIELRRSQSLNVIALIAYYFDPSVSQSKLTAFELNEVNTFLLEELTAEGIEDWTKFQEKSGIFEILHRKKLTDPIVFWKTAKLQAPHLANFALRCLRIPASTIHIERIFSNWSFTHLVEKHRYSPDVYQKLLHVYYSFKVKEENK